MPLSDHRSPAPGSRLSVRRQGIFWMLTIPHHCFTPYLPPGCVWIRGQHELSLSGYSHWQILVAMSTKSSLAQVKSVFGEQCHAELSRSESAQDYVWKEDTRVDCSQFEFGSKPIRRNSRVDWESVWSAAKSGDLLQIPANVRVVSYRTLRAIKADYEVPQSMERTALCYWGPTGTGKSLRSSREAGIDAYYKDPRTKFWCGYRGQQHVIVDEFRGAIDISHLLRWLDRYPCYLETKGSSTSNCVTKFWFTSNLHPDFWYPDLDELTRLALIRRISVLEITELDTSLLP
ncbi:replication-associated protein [Dragonfly larvae associated circular virus-1]|uniref:Replication-associated protein n=1 Tax=Dragonfly larvae associated circular virus-1 TaxID=1454021 RepID=W5U268_9VIRU|nr:replication-associated protein [Dragonfly larvae associated circular virus-1]AHH31460.1 replication-associated protein [Dragonfly larvae associated circular virus-1]